MSTRIKVPDGLRQARKIAEKAGWTIERTGGQHLRWIPPDGSKPVTTASTTGYWRSNRNAIANLRQAGLDI